MSEEMVSTFVEPAEAEPSQNTAEQAITEVEPVKVEDPIQKADPEKEAEKAKADEEKKGQSRLNRKIDKAYRERAEAQAETEMLKRQLEEFKPKPQTTGLPKIEDFDDIQSFTTAVAEYSKTEAIKEHETNLSQESQQENFQQLTRNWEDQVVKGEEKYDDFDKIVGDLKPNDPWSVAIFSAENGADIAYHLGKNREEIEKIVQLNPFFQAFEIGKLSARLASQSPAAKKASNAPAPIRPLSGTVSNSDKKLSDVSDQDEWDNRRRKYIADKRR